MSHVINTKKGKTDVMLTGVFSFGICWSSQVRKDMKMRCHKVTVSVDGRNLETLVREGVLATIETGKHVDKVKTPSNRISIMTGQRDGKSVAWVQVARVGADGVLSITNEGWIGDGQEQVASLSKGPGAKSSLEILEQIPEKSRATLEKAQFGVMGCCTAYGNGCYVTCCNGCCADPVGCPGASCCG
jgi:hypothetical protein